MAMFPPEQYPEVLAGLSRPDDAAVYAIDADQALILTTDFFPPIVDDPYAYGAIAAANAVSDVYAMGGRVLLALNIAVFPQCLDEAAVAEILRGGAEKVREAGGALAGGHTIEGPEPLFGMAVLGIARRDRLWTKAGALPGDVLVLTKPLGTGMVATAAKAGEADPAHVEEAGRWMATLNRAAAEAASRFAVHAATDITGFGLIGHASEMACAGRVGLRLHYRALPLLPGAEEYAAGWLFPAGTNHNEAAFASLVTFAPDIPEERRLLMLTPETSGGLLLAMPAAEAAAFAERCLGEGVPAWRVGEVTAADSRIEIEP